jgi:CRP-like cAMP-binding protein
MSLSPATRRVPITNRILSGLPAKARAQVLAACEPVALKFLDTVADPGDKMTHVYFSTQSAISLVTAMGGKANLEVALVGNEGFYGVPLALGVNASPVHALVQGAGHAWRMDATDFAKVLKGVPTLKQSIDRYIYVLMSQLVQTAGCNRFHVVEQRLARWLLMTSDRAHSSSFHITHEFLAYMLGVRRVGITTAASALQGRNLIHYVRGDVEILDRKGLERASCGCYRADIVTYEKILGPRA